MTCPRCNVSLIIADRQGVEIDHCPQCRGIWLDRGELDVLIEKTTQTMNRNDDLDGGDPYKRSFDSHHGHDDDNDRYENGNRGYEYNNQNRGRKKGFLADLFDF